jgi:hypothetical protein
MNTNKPLIGALAVLAVFLIGVIWHQRGNAALQQRKIETLEVEASGLKREIATQQEESTRLKNSQVNAAQAAKPPPAAPTPSPKSESKADPARNPEARALYLTKKSAEMEAGLRAEFLALGFSVPQWEQYKRLILEAENITLDARQMAEDKNLGPRERELAMAQSANELRAQLQGLLGAEAYQELIGLNRQQPIRQFVGDLAQAVMFTENALSKEQATAYLNALQNNLQSLRRNAGGFVINEPLLTQLQTILNPEQMRILRSQQDAIKAAQQLNALGKK